MTMKSCGSHTSSLCCRRLAPTDRDALAVCFSFTVIRRLADSFGFFVPGPKDFEIGAKYLLARHR